MFRMKTLAQRLTVFAVLLLPPLLLAGCRRHALSYEKTVTAEAGDAYQAQTIEPSARDQ
jgi:hypothetical protein